MWSKQLAVLDEAAAGRELVIERLGGGVGFVGEPIDPARPLRLRSFVHGLDQGASGAAATRLLRREEILEIAVVAGGPGGAMEDVMHDSDDPIVENRRKAMDRLGGVVQPPPRGVRDLRR